MLHSNTDVATASVTGQCLPGAADRERATTGSMLFQAVAVDIAHDGLESGGVGCIPAF